MMMHDGPPPVLNGFKMHFGPPSMPSASTDAHKHNTTTPKSNRRQAPQGCGASERGRSDSIEIEAEAGGTADYLRGSSQGDKEEQGEGC